MTASEQGTLDCDDGCGEIAVADDPPELPSASHAWRRSALATVEAALDPPELGCEDARVCLPQRYLSVLPLIPAVTIGCGGSGEGRVLAEGKNLGAFEASPNPFKFDAAHARRFVITKVEVFGPGQLNGFPGECSGGTCAATPDKWPIVIVSTELEPQCQRSAHEFVACASALDVQCSLGEESPLSPTYIWWERDSAGQRKPHSCSYTGIEHPSELILLGFVPHVRTPPTSFRLVVQGRDVPIRLTP